jgi:ATP-dependent helicase/nuclease subunit A
MTGPGTKDRAPLFEPVALPREMVLASAGSGKTYYLSSRFIGLLARGVPAEAIWASTFTRKAAAEIQERVLLRLARGALDEKEAERLAEDAWLDPHRPPPPNFLNQGQCGRLLSDLVFSLHRANVGTLDSFFVRVAGSFARELDLSPAWRMVQGPEEDRMRSEALEVVLNREDSAVVAELVRIMAKGNVHRGVHGLLLDQVENLLQTLREVDPTVDDAWVLQFPSAEGGGALTKKDIRRRCAQLADELVGVGAPGNEGGAPRNQWEGEVLRLSGAVRTGDWKEFFRVGIGKKLVDSGELIPAGEVTYRSKSPVAEEAVLLDEAVGLARADLALDIKAQAGALERLAGWYGQAFEEAQEGQGGYRFGDITHLLRESRTLGDSDSLYFRLDAHIQHLLLDEFQDTSLPQWEVMEPLMTELVAGGEMERAAVLVADPKQSIYGWRGARPGLVHEVKGSYPLKDEELEKSYRSGPTILKTVDDVFSGLEINTVIQEMDGGPDVARSWIQDLYGQESDDKNQPGYTELRVGPGVQGFAGVQPYILDYSAELIGEIHAGEPRASIGVLVRTNRVVSYLIAALRQMKIPASGEGGTPLTDAAPVNALLALLRLADHPGDRLARYHVAQTPVGEVVGYTHYQAGAEANRLARRIRGRLLRDGYGATLDGWAKELEPSCDVLERARLLQLVELGFQWDGERTLRPADFVRLVENQRVEDPSGARIRVMTIHQSKGLEFDVVVLPHLYASMEKAGSQSPVVPLRHEVTGRVVKVFPTTDKATRILLPELRESHDQNRAARLRDELSTLYVAMTRARYALHMVVPMDGPSGPGTAKTGARVLRDGLAPGEAAESVGQILAPRGNPEWFEKLKASDFSGAVSSEAGGLSPLDASDVVPLKAVSGARVRNVARRSPSSLEGGEELDLATHLRLDLRGDARLRGTVVHAWCEALEWMDEGLPDDSLLLAVAKKEAPGLAHDRIQEWHQEFRSWMEAPAIREALSRASYPDGALVERELPFLHRVPDGILQGYIDRLVLIQEGGRVVAAEVLDFKTDVLDGADVGAVTEKVAFYRPQIDAYRTAVAGRYRLDPSAVSGKLLFLRPGLVREV